MLLERCIRVIGQDRVQHFVDDATIVAEIAERRRQFLPPDVAGRFMRASLPRPSTSCRGAMAVSATDAVTLRTSVQCMSRPSVPRYSRASAFSRSTSSALRTLPPAPPDHQPMAVSLSCVPV